MKNAPVTFFSGIDSKSLKIINDISFTRREIDVIACCLSGKAAKGIASFLGMSPRTVETHTRAIMLKLGCNSREGIIEFIEKSDKFSLIKNHYSFLLTEADFKRRLQEISILIRHQNPFSFIISRVDHEQDPFLNEIIYYLTLVGIKVRIANTEKLTFSQPLMSFLPTSYVLYKIPATELPTIRANDFNREDKNNLLTQKDTHYPILFILRRDISPIEIPQAVSEIGYVNFKTCENDYCAFFELLKKILPKIPIDPIFSTFKRQYETAYEITHKPFFEKNLQAKEFIRGSKVISVFFFFKTFIKNKRFLFLSGGIFLGTICMFFLTSSFKTIFDEQQNLSSVRSDLPLPHESFLLTRSKILAQIKQAFQANQGIQSIALIGIGGAGKTTLARQYAHQQDKQLYSINLKKPVL